MPTHLLLRASFQFQDDSPKNQAVITPHFRRQLDVLDPTSGADALQLCKDLADKFAFLPGLGGTPYKVTAYNVEGAKPRYPLAEEKRNVAGAIKSPGVPPEVAVCLSFYSGQNRPSYRGRIYWPAWLLGAVASDMAKTVPTALRNAAATQLGYMASLGGANVDFGVWSPTTQAFHKASDYFISDAWAIQRRRGIKETARTVGTTSG